MESKSSNQWGLTQQGWQQEPDAETASVEQPSSSTFRPNETLGKGPLGQQGSDTETKSGSYGQQLLYERTLRAWTQEQLAEKVNVLVSTVQSWENDSVSLDLTSRLKLSQILGNDFYLSSEVSRDKKALRVRIDQWLLAAQDFATVISVLTEFHTQFWLIQQGRFADLVEYAEAQDNGTLQGRFEKQANLVIEGLSLNSPALIALITDPHIVTNVVTTTVTLVVALDKAVNVIAQTWKKIQEINQEHQKNKLALKQKQLAIEEKQLALEQKRLAMERKHEEEQEIRKQKEIESAIAMMVKIADTLHPGADEQARATMIQAFTPVCWKILDRE